MYKKKPISCQPDLIPPNLARLTELAPLCTPTCIDCVSHYSEHNQPEIRPMKVGDRRDWPTLRQGWLSGSIWCQIRSFWDFSSLLKEVKPTETY